MNGLTDKMIDKWVIGWIDGWRVGSMFVLMGGLMDRWVTKN